ncbi:hypothetical protein LCGC14_1679440, partial [marine sediment metagenome]
MKVLNADIMNAKEPLEKILQLPLPVKAALQVAKFANKLEDEWRVIENVRQGLIKKYGKTNGDQISVDHKSKEWG